MRELDLGAALQVAFPYAFPRLMIQRRNIVNVETKAGWIARAGIRGQADFYIMGAGVHVEVETKSAKPKWYAAQVAWRDRCASLGIPYVALRALPKEAPDVTITRWLEELRCILGRVR